MSRATSEPKLRFKAVLEKDGQTSGTGIKMPFDVEKQFGTRGRVPVCGTLNGAPFRSTLAPYSGAHYLPVNRALRGQAKAAAGDAIDVVLQRDDAPRVIEAPADFARAMKTNPAAAAAWERLSYTHRREYVEAIAEAKRPETRDRRIQGAITELARERPPK